MEQLSRLLANVDVDINRQDDEVSHMVLYFIFLKLNIYTKCNHNLFSDSHKWSSHKFVFMIDFCKQFKYTCASVFVFSCVLSMNSALMGKGVSSLEWVWTCH